MRVVAEGLAEKHADAGGWQHVLGRLAEPEVRPRRQVDQQLGQSRAQGDHVAHVKGG